MNNRLSLKEYFFSFRSNVEKRKIFYAIFQEMHRFHNNGEYITNLSFETIDVCYTNPLDVHFLYYDKIGIKNMGKVLEIKMCNILKLSQMMISAFMDNFCGFEVLELEVIEKQLLYLVNIFHPDDYIYLEKVFIDKEYIYYDDYIRSLDGMDDVPFLEKRKITESEEAFTNYLLLIINLAVVVLLFSCFLLYSCKAIA